MAARSPAATSLQPGQLVTLVLPKIQFRNCLYLLVVCAVHARISAVIFCIFAGRLCRNKVSRDQNFKCVRRIAKQSVPSGKITKAFHNARRKQGVSISGVQPVIFAFVFTTQAQEVPGPDSPCRSLEGSQKAEVLRCPRTSCIRHRDSIFLKIGRAHV